MCEDLQNTLIYELGDLHDDVNWLQLPESFTFTLSYVNYGNCYLNPTRNSKFK